MPGYGALGALAQGNNALMSALNVPIPTQMSAFME
jgi:hypothetical protein